MLAVTASAQDEETLEEIRNDFPELNQIRIPDVEKVTLDNGMKLYILEDNSLPVFNASVRIDCGSYLDPADKVGLASICGTVMRTGGTEKYSGDELDEILEGIGATVETSIDIDHGSAYVNCLSDYTDLGLEILAEVLRRPVFDGDKIELAKVDERTAISRRNDEVGQVARREFRKLIYGADSPYARHTEYATIDAITRDDLMNYHQQWFHPENIRMAVWGDFDKDALLEKINQYFGDWPTGNVEVPPLPEVSYDWRSKVYYIDKPDAAQTYVRLGHIGGKVTDPDYTDRIVMNSILGLGFGSRLMKNVRTKEGLAYSTGGLYISNYTYPGYFLCLASTNHENTVAATQEMIKQIESMQTDPPTREEMEYGKDGYLNSFVFKFDSKRKIINRMMEYEAYGLPEDFLQKEKEGVEQVTPEDVVQAAKDNLRPDQLIILAAGNGAEFDMPLDSLGLGPVDTIDITIPTAEEEDELVVTPEAKEKGQALLMAGVEATGGLEAFKNIESIETKGTMTLFMQGQQLPIKLHQIDMPPDKHRVEMSIMGQKMYDIRNGDTGWKTDQATMGMVEKTDSDIESDEEDKLRNTVYIFRQADNPSYQAVYAGEGVVDGTPVEWVALLDENEETICRLGFHTEDNSLVCQKYWGESPAGEGNMQKMFHDRQDYAGVMLPVKTVISMNGQKVMELTVDQRTVNGTIPEGTFTKP